MSMVPRLAGAVLAGMLVTLSATVSVAQGTNPFGRTPTSLKDSEMPLIIGTVDRVLREYRVGATASWRSAETGRAGTSTITELFQRQGWRCAQVTHHFTAGGGGTFTAPLCETEPGSWKFAF